MLPGMSKNKDGSLTIYIQKDAPSADKRANWLPAPDGPIHMVMRLYWPKETPPSILPPVPAPGSRQRYRWCSNVGSPALFLVGKAGFMGRSSGISIRATCDNSRVVSYSETISSTDHPRLGS
jgi:hypothetical protein